MTDTVPGFHVAIRPKTRAPSPVGSGQCCWRPASSDSYDQQRRRCDTPSPARVLGDHRDIASGGAIFVVAVMMLKTLVQSAGEIVPTD